MGAWTCTPSARCALTTRTRGHGERRCFRPSAALVRGSSPHARYRVPSSPPLVRSPLLFGGACWWGVGRLLPQEWSPGKTVYHDVLSRVTAGWDVGADPYRPGGDSAGGVAGAGRTRGSAQHRQSFILTLGPSHHFDSIPALGREIGGRLLQVRPTGGR